MCLVDFELSISEFCSMVTKWFILHGRHHFFSRKFHIHPILAKHSTLGEYHLYTELRKYANSFFEYLRMEPETVDYIVGKIKPRLIKG